MTDELEGNGAFIDDWISGLIHLHISSEHVIILCVFGQVEEQFLYDTPVEMLQFFLKN